VSSTRDLTARASAIADRLLGRRVTGLTAAQRELLRDALIHAAAQLAKAAHGLDSSPPHVPVLEGTVANVALLFTVATVATGEESRSALGELRKLLP
jgi:hypothetical protein